MRPYIVFLDQLQSGVYQLAIAPFIPNGGGAMATKQYPTKEALMPDLKDRLRLSDAAIERFLADPSHGYHRQDITMSDEDAAHLGWVNS